MATLVELDQVGAVIKLDPALGAGQQELRVIYLSPRCETWLRDVLHTLGSTWNIEEFPTEQLDALVSIFASGKTLTYGEQFKPLQHIKNGVWELKTADLRVIGWFPCKDCFVSVSADTADRIKQHKLYNGYIGEAVKFRDALNLDEPKFVVGEDPNDVVSDYAYP